MYKINYITCLSKIRFFIFLQRSFLFVLLKSNVLILFLKKRHVRVSGGEKWMGGQHISSTAISNREKIGKQLSRTISCLNI